MRRQDRRLPEIRRRPPVLPRTPREEVLNWHYVGESRNGVWGLYVEEGRQYDYNGREWDEVRAAARAAAAARSGAEAVPETPAEPPPAVPPAWHQRHVERHAVPVTGPLANPLAGRAAHRLSLRLGLPEDVFATLPVLYLDNDGYNAECWVFPEKAADGHVTSYVFRYGNGDKDKRAHGPRGLTIPEGWEDRPGPLYVPEGASDTLALTAMGLAAVGRPNARAGVEYLAELLAARAPDRCVVVLGENDRKEDGTWEGRDGAFVFAHQLAIALGRNVAVAFPPAEHKDVREWFRARRPAVPAELAQPFADDLTGFAEVTPAADGVPCPDDLSDLGGDPPHDPSHESSAESPAVPPDPPEPSPFPPLSEEQLAAIDRESRRDFRRFPCPQERQRTLIMLDIVSGDPYLLHVRCSNRAECPGCRAYLNDRDLMNLRMRFNRAERDGRQLYEVTCPSRRWEALRKRIRRAGGDYACVREGGDSDLCFVVTTANIGLPVTAEAAASTVGVILDRYHDRPRPVRTCRPWSRANITSVPRARLIGLADPGLTDETIREIGDAVGCATVTQPYQNADRSNIQRTTRHIRRDNSRWTDDDRQWYFGMFMCGEALPRDLAEAMRAGREERRKRRQSPGTPGTAAPPDAPEDSDDFF
jgi:hypothetical protein